MKKRPVMTINLWLTIILCLSLAAGLGGCLPFVPLSPSASHQQDDDPAQTGQTQASIVPTGTVPDSRETEQLETTYDNSYDDLTDNDITDSHGNTGSDTFTSADSEDNQETESTTFPDDTALTDELNPTDSTIPDITENTSAQTDSETKPSETQTESTTRPASETEPADDPSTDNTTEKPVIPDSVTHLTYTVQPGDTLFSIAQSFKTTISSLAAINQISDTNLIYAGQILIIPTGAETDTLPVFDASLDNTSRGWRYQVPSPLYQDKPAYVTANIAALVSRYHVIWQLPDSHEKVVYLTMDAGYEYENNTSDILDIVARKKVQISFFVTGSFILHQPDLVLRMVSEGHQVANHTERHLNQPEALAVSVETLKNDIIIAEQRFKALTGQTFAPYLRPPSGIYSERSLAYLQSLGYKPVFWSFAYADWQTDKQPDPDFAFDKIMGQLHPGSVLLLHTVSNTNVSILARLIDGIHARGYRIATLP